MPVIMPIMRVQPHAVALAKNESAKISVRNIRAMFIYSIT